MSVVMFVGAWDPNQPRDERGMWTSAEGSVTQAQIDKLPRWFKSKIHIGDVFRKRFDGWFNDDFGKNDVAFKTAPIRRVRVDALIAGQDTLDADKLTRFAKRGFAGKAPEPYVIEHKGQLLLREGHHRVALAKLRGHRFVNARVLPGKKPSLLEIRAAEWDEEKHPRVPAGSEEGGQFTSAGRDFTDSELRQQVEAASARTQAFGFHPEHVADLSKMKPADRVAFIKAYGEMAANPTLFYSNLRFSGARMRAYDAFFAEMKNDPTRLLERGLAEGFYSRTREGEFTYDLGGMRPFRDALGGLDAGGRDEFEREFVAAFKNGGKGFSLDDTTAFHEAGWTSAELERFADRVQAAGGSYTKWSKETDYASIHSLAGQLAFYSQDYENFRGHVFSGWALTGGSDTAVTLRRAAEEAFPSPSGEFYRVKPNRGNPAVEALYSPRAVENIRALKAETEAFYRAKFKGKDPAGKPLEVHRGIGGHVEAYTPGSIESWTRDIRTVSKFGKMMSNQAGEHSALRTTVNYNDVLWSYESAAGKHGWPPEKDLKGKKEFVVIGQRVGFVEREKR